ncbi:MAG: Cache 3/Cache 2 fusion domain-containing protein [Thiotrichaceae bacterium]|nr:Cache 3/Cache 2 fusion domain-containing protein [Thiotrichaceae bacterium]
MINHFQISLTTKLALINISGILIILGIFIGVTIWQASSYNSHVEQDMEKLINAELNHTIKGILTLIYSQNKTIDQQVKNSIKIAEYIVEKHGGLYFPELDTTENLVQWNANYEKTQKVLSLPKIMIGNNTWLGQHEALDKTVPILSEFQKMTGVGMTIFQRMNEQGDMLRVATTVEKEGKRAIGTYIPAFIPSSLDEKVQGKKNHGTPNPVVSHLLQGKNYQNIVLVINDWYLSIYKPLFNEQGEVVGSLSVGMKQDQFDILRKTITDISIGKTGYAFVLEGKGKDKGRYIISQDGELDGQQVWNNKDAEGNFHIQRIINTATALQKDKFETITYNWREEEDQDIRKNRVNLAYYEPWDWVIGISLYEDEILDYGEGLSQRLLKVLGTLILVGLLLSFLVVGVTIIVAHNIMTPINQFTQRIQKIMGTQFKHRSELKVFTHSMYDMETYLQNKVQQIKQLQEGCIYNTIKPSSEHDDLGKALAELNVQVRQWVDTTQTHITDLEKLTSPVTKNQHASLYESNQHHIEHIVTFLDKIAQETEGLAVNTTLNASQNLASEQEVKLDTNESRQHLQHTLSNLNQCISEISQSSKTIHSATKRLQTISQHSEYNNQWVTQSTYASSQQLAQSISNITTRLKQSMNSFFDSH